MRRFFLSPLVLGLLCLVPATGYALPNPYYDSAWMRETKEAVSDTLPLDKAILELSRSNDANLLVDMSDIVADPTNPAHLNGTRLYSPSMRQSIIGNFAYRRNLSHEVTGEHTFVLWQQPDGEHLLDLILADQKRLDRDFPPIDEKSTALALQEFYARNYNWNPNPQTFEEKQASAKGVDKLLPLSDFPPALRHAFQSDYLQQARVYRTFRRNVSYQTLDPDYWKNARIFIRNISGPTLFGDKLYDNDAAIGIVSLNAPFESFLVGCPHIPKQNHLASIERPPLANLAQDLQKQMPVTPPQNLAQQADFEVTTHQGVIPQWPQPSSTQVSQNPALQKKVAFEATRVTLKEFVADLQKQTGVILKVVPKIEEKTLIARSEGMPLAEALQSLARLYQGRWATDGETYTLTPYEMDELRSLMARMGLHAHMGYNPVIPEGRDELGATLADEVYGAVDTAEMESNKGAAFADLPEDLRSRILKLYRGDTMGDMLRQEQRLNDARAQDVRVLFTTTRGRVSFWGNTQADTLNQRPAKIWPTTLGAFTPDGLFITPLVSSFKVLEPNKDDNTMRDNQLPPGFIPPPFDPAHP